MATLGSRTLSADAYRVLLRQIHALAFSHPQPFVLLIDVMGVTKPDALCRKAIAEEMQSYVKQDQGRLRGIGLIVGASLHRGVMTALNWLVHPPYPMAVFENVPTAKVWAQRQLPAGASAVLAR
jgi:hypothetical protein